MTVCSILFLLKNKIGWVKIRRPPFVFTSNKHAFNQYPWKLLQVFKECEALLSLINLFRESN